MSDIEQISAVDQLLAEERWDLAEKQCRRELTRGGDSKRLKSALTSVLIRNEKWSASRKYWKKLEATVPGCGSAIELAHVLLFAKGPATAISMLEQTVPEPKLAASHYVALGKLYLRSGEGERADAAFRQAVLHDIDIAWISDNLDHFPASRRIFKRALKSYVSALTIGCDTGGRLPSKYSVLLAMGLEEFVIRLLEREIENNPEPEFALRNLARVLELLGRNSDAEEKIFDILSCPNRQINSVTEFATILFKKRKYEEALKFIRNILLKDPKNIRLLAFLVSVLIVSSRTRGEARPIIEIMHKIEPHGLSVFISRGQYYNSTKEYDLAIKSYEDGLKIYPAAVELYEPLGNVFLRVGYLDRAAEYLTRASTFSPEAWATLDDHHISRNDPFLINRMSEFSKNRLVPITTKTKLKFSLAKYYDRKKDYSIAFNYVKSANKAVSKIISYSPQKHNQKIKNLVKLFSTEFFSSHPGGGSSSVRPIFVCGLPRSGTSLTEQILATHPKIHGAGELPNIRLIRESFRELTSRPAAHWSIHSTENIGLAAQKYLSALSRIHPSSARVVDKTNSNYMDIGLISLLFPEAKIINVVRDYRDTMISLYFSDFNFMWDGNSPRRPPLEFSFDIGNISNNIEKYDFLMNHWLDILKTKIFNLDYQDLLDNLEHVSRRLFEFIEIDWRPEVMTFHDYPRSIDNPNVWNVRKPLYRSSTNRWRNYAAFFPLLENPRFGRGRMDSE